jgi:hypothetical protein
VVQARDTGVLLIQFGFSESKQVGGDISFLFEDITKLMTLLVNGYPVDVAKFASGKMRGFGEDEFVTIMLTMGVGGMRRLGRSKYRRMMGNGGT